MKTRIVYPKRWNDREYINTSKETKVVFEFLIGGDFISLTPVQHIGDHLIGFFTHLTQEEVQTAKKELEQIKWCFFYKDWVFHNHDAAYVNYTGRDRVMKSKVKEILSVPPNVLEHFKGLVTRYKEVINLSKTINHKSKTINHKPKTLNIANKPELEVVNPDEIPI